jgi:4-hydroxy-3-methylbut-2-enyl diphosphate reductase
MTVDQNPPPQGVSETQNQELILDSAHDASQHLPSTPHEHTPVSSSLSELPSEDKTAEPAETISEEASSGAAVNIDAVLAEPVQELHVPTTAPATATDGLPSDRDPSSGSVHTDGDALPSVSGSKATSIGSDESKPTPDIEVVSVTHLEEASPLDSLKPPLDLVAPEEVASVEVAPATAPSSDVDLFESYMSAMDRGEDPETAIDSGYKRLQKGDRIEATVIQVDRDKVFVDLGTKAEGIIPLAELSEENIDSAKGLFNIGDKIYVVVLRPEGAEGNPIVSKRRADFEEAWDRIEEAFKTQEMITAQVVDRVKGGLVVDVGVRGFVPATHVGSGKLRNIEKFVGQPLQLKVIEIDRERKKVVLSNRQAEEERRQSAKEEIFKAVRPGEILEGSVRRLTDYGAFVDLGGVDGLLHISEMSWARINHPKEMFKEGQKIKVMVLRLDEKAGKISLGHRQVLPDPWNLIKQNYKIGQTLKVIIGRIVLSGAFIKLPEGAEAFMPVSEMSYRRIKRPQDVVEENQEVEVQIIDLRPDERRMVLSMRAIGGGSELRPSAGVETPGYESDRGKDRGKKVAKKGGRGGRDFDDDFEESVGRRGFATGGATIGERLGMLKGFLSRDEDEEEKPTGEEKAVEDDSKLEG